jgi:hypothetical protein
METDDAQTPPRSAVDECRRAAGASPRQAAPVRCRLHHRTGSAASPAGPRRWAAAVAALVALQEEYGAWLDRLPESLQGAPTADKPQAITELDLDELLAIDPPRGYGRD